MTIAHKFQILVLSLGLGFAGYHLVREMVHLVREIRTWPKDEEEVPDEED